MTISIDPSFGALVSLITDFMTIVAAIIGVIALNRWQSQLRWQSKFSSACQIMKLARQFQDQFHEARGMWGSKGESADRVIPDDEQPKQKRNRDEAYARINRLEPVRHTLIELYQNIWEAEIVFNRDLRELIEPFGTAFRDIRLAIDLLFSDDQDGLSPEQRIDARSKVYGIASDEFGKLIDEATDQVSNALRKELGLRR